MSRVGYSPVAGMAALLVSLLVLSSAGWSEANASASPSPSPSVAPAILPPVQAPAASSGSMNLVSQPVSTVESSGVAVSTTSVGDAGSVGNSGSTQELPSAPVVPAGSPYIVTTPLQMTGAVVHSSGMTPGADPARSAVEAVAVSGSNVQSDAPAAQDNASQEQGNSEISQEDAALPDEVDSSTTVDAGFLGSTPANASGSGAQTGENRDVGLQSLMKPVPSSVQKPRQTDDSLNVIPSKPNPGPEQVPETPYRDGMAIPDNGVYSDSDKGIYSEIVGIISKNGVAVQVDHEEKRNGVTGIVEYFVDPSKPEGYSSVFMTCPNGVSGGKCNSNIQAQSNSPIQLKREEISRAYKSFTCDEAQAYVQFLKSRGNEVAPAKNKTSNDDSQKRNVSLQSLTYRQSTNLGVQDIALVLTKPKGGKDPDVTNLQAAMEKVNELYKEMSYGQTSLRWTMHGPYEVEDSYPNNRDGALEALAKEVDIRNYNFVMDLDERNPNGFGFIGKEFFYDPEQSYDSGLEAQKETYPHYGYSWVSLQGSRSLEDWIRILAHEFGHNFGARHSAILYCKDRPMDVPENCTAYRAGNPLDLMGGGLYHMNPFFKETIGWLDGRITSASQNGEYKIYPYETNNTDLVLSVPKTDLRSSGDTYGIVYRAPVGVDAKSRDLAGGGGLEISFQYYEGNPYAHDNYLNPVGYLNPEGDVISVTRAFPRDGTLLFKAGQQFVGMDGVIITPIEITPEYAKVKVDCLGYGTSIAPAAVSNT